MPIGRKTPCPSFACCRYCNWVPDLTLEIPTGGCKNIQVSNSIDYRPATCTRFRLATMKYGNCIPLLLLWMLLSGGCATLFESEYRVIELQTDPPYSRVKVRITHPTDPYEIEIPSLIDTDTLHFSSTIRIVDPCFMPGEMPFEKRFSEATLLNYLNSGIGVVIDYLTGEIWQYRHTTKIPVARNPTEMRIISDMNSPFKPPISKRGGPTP